MTEEEIVAELLEKENVTEIIERRLARRTQYQPVVTISREPGSGGRPIAEALAKKIGFRFIDGTLVGTVGKRMKLPPEVLGMVDEKSRSGIVDFVQNMLNPNYVSDEAYFRNMCQVIIKQTQRGGAVIVGRGANFVSPQAYCLRVRVVAPYRVRVARAVEFENIDRDEARERIRSVTADREKYVKQYFGKNISSSKYYDLVINTTFFSIDQSVELITRAYKMKFPTVKIG